MATGAAVAAILSGDPERALFECGTLLSNASREEAREGPGPSTMDVFEDTIIQCLSVIGEALSETADVPPAAASVHDSVVAIEAESHFPDIVLNA